MSPDELVKPKIIRALPNSTRKKLRTRWSWYPFLPLGEVTLLTGPTDQGKSTLCLDIAGAMTRGRLKGEFEGTPVNVLYLACEDTVEMDIAPKLEATDAVRDRFYDVVVENGWLNLPGDLKELEDLVDQTSAKAIFLDPITSVVSGDKNKQHEVRPVIEAIRGLAARKGIAIIGVIHQRKGNAGSATEAVIGSAEWVNVARSVLAVRQHKEQEGVFIFSIGKGNRAPREDRVNLSYTFDHKYVALDDSDELQRIPKIRWIGETDISVDDMMEAASSGARVSDTTDAVTWLESVLDSEGGEVSIPELQRLSKANGFAQQTVETAARRLGLKTRQQGTNRVFVRP